MTKTKQSPAILSSHDWTWPDDVFYGKDCDGTFQVAVLSFGCLQRIATSIEAQEKILRRMDRRMKEAAAKRRRK